MRDLTVYIDDRLSALEITDQPFAVAFSGGGDSTALVHALAQSAATQKPRIFIVDHGLQTGSGEQASQAAAFARSLGLQADILTRGPQNFPTALQAKARQLRYGLLGEACRQAGLQYLLTAHTEDDQAETVLMRFDHYTDWRGAAGISERAYAPVWPELAGVTLIRPLLDISRRALRDYNHAHDLNWHEDVANQNLSFERIRARRRLAKKPPLRQLMVETARDMAKGRARERIFFKSFLASGKIRISRNGAITAPRDLPPTLLGHLLRAASGQDQLAGQDNLAQLQDKMMQADFAGATLGGAGVHPINAAEVLITPDRDQLTGRGPNRATITALNSIRLKKGVTIWMGRYRLISQKDGMRVSPVYAERANLSREWKDYLAHYPAQIRDFLPVVLSPDGQVLSIGAGAYAPHNLDVQSLTAERFSGQI